MLFRVFVVVLFYVKQRERVPVLFNVYYLSLNVLSWTIMFNFIFLIECAKCSLKYTVN